MSYKKYSYYVLCEDKNQYYLIKSYLECKGVQDRKIKLYKELPEGKGDAKQFVREHYEQAKKKIKINPQSMLIVAHDADNETYTDVKKKFSASDDAVFLVILKRNVETWFHFLNHQNDDTSKDETTDRKLKCRRVRPTKYGKKLEDVINKKRQSISLSNTPDSLEETISALLKLEKY
jgi:hypothetical protein